jgi:transposase
MEVLYARCCGLDVHKKTVVACLSVVGRRGKREKTTRVFQADTLDLYALRDWLLQAGCTHVAMESTGFYWKPAYNILEDHLQVTLANAQHIRGLPGRKTDVADAEWLVDLLQHGLIRASFVPDRQQRELRELTRYRKSLIRLRTAEVNRIQKVLSGANIKLDTVVSDLMGMSGREMLAALMVGTLKPEEMAQLARGRLREKLTDLERALTGFMGPHQRFMLAQQLTHIALLQSTIEACTEEIEQRLAVWGDALARLCTIPGVGPRTGQVILAEIGIDMSRFPSAHHLASWAGMCPGNHESGGKRLSGKTRKGDLWLRQALVESAHAAKKVKASYLAAQHRRLTARRGSNVATVAVAHTILVTAYYILKRGTVYQELGAAYFDQRQPEKASRRMVKRLESLGYRVTLERAEPAAAAV